MIDRFFLFPFLLVVFNGGGDGGGGEGGGGEGNLHQSLLTTSSVADFIPRATTETGSRERERERERERQ